jgi:hypothetical protein
MDAVPSTPVSQQLSRPVGLPNAPTVTDVRVDEDDPQLRPGANHRSHHQDSRPRQLP